MDLQALNETSGIWACFQFQNSSVLNGSLEVPNGTCGDALLLPKTQPVRPKVEFGNMDASALFSRMEQLSWEVFAFREALETQTDVNEKRVTATPVKGHWVKGD
ncbi:hypothetical protein E1301_Tti012893 [Triplophysa tibetana]|uniref:Uncharacterized protein n=1 Tax=Triplophysa tibetana TaxID=1572043 RepID=A0A5A9P2B5_9TELE|nr:hypothetical protein E1301_Tti012893 [Triplophysa tibetana]